MMDMKIIFTCFLIFQDALRTFNRSEIFLVDSSIRFHSSNITSLQNIALGSNGVCAFILRHSIFSATPPDMFRFLPMVKSAKKEGCRMGGLVLLYRTKFVIDNILHWWVACALSRTCIYSERNRFCQFTKDRWNDFAHCSRYSQSALSIILVNTFSNSTQMLGPDLKDKKLLEIARFGSSNKVKKC